MLKIATEEAFSIPEVADALGRVSRTDNPSLDMPLGRSDLYRDGAGGAHPLLKGLLDWDQRLRVMGTENEVDMHLLSLTAPGVQMFETEEAIALARLANDRLAEQVAAHPGRYAGPLASFAPQDLGRGLRAKLARGPHSGRGGRRPARRADRWPAARARSPLRSRTFARRAQSATAGASGLHSPSPSP